MADRIGGFEMISRNFASNLACVLLSSLVASTQLLAQTKQAAGPTIEETHAFIEKMIAGKRIPYAWLHPGSGRDHYDDFIWSVDMYSGERCQVTYRRKSEITPRNDDPFEIEFKKTKFDMTKMVDISLESMNRFYEISSELPSKDLVFTGPGTVWTNGRDEEEMHRHVIIVSTLNSERILKAFQRLKVLCPTPEDVF